MRTATWSRITLFTTLFAVAACGGGDDAETTESTPAEATPVGPEAEVQFLEAGSGFVVAIRTDRDTPVQIRQQSIRDAEGNQRGSWPARVVDGRTNAQGVARLSIPTPPPHSPTTIRIHVGRGPGQGVVEVPYAAAPTFSDGYCRGPNRCRMEASSSGLRILLPTGAQATVDGNIVVATRNSERGAGLPMAGSVRVGDAALSAADLSHIGPRAQNQPSGATVPVSVRFADGTAVEGEYSLPARVIASLLGSRVRNALATQEPLVGASGRGVLVLGNARQIETSRGVRWSGTLRPPLGARRLSEVGFIVALERGDDRAAGRCNYRLANGRSEPATKLQRVIVARLFDAGGNPLTTREFRGDRPSCPSSLAAGDRTVHGSDPDRGEIERWLTAEATRRAR